MRSRKLTRRQWLVVGCLFVGGGAAAIALRKISGDAPLLAVTDDYCVVAPLLTFDPAWGIALLAPRAVPPDARCPVCGMFPSRSPEWAAQIVFDDGDTQFFDSPLSLFTYLQDVGRYTAGRNLASVAAQYVRDSATSEWIHAPSAFYVHGSDAVGPMRAGNLPAFSSDTSAQAFASRRGGQVIRAGQISPTMLQTLSGVKRHLHQEAAV